MAFNHYAKVKRILKQQSPGWYIKRIPSPTTTKAFNGEVKTYPYYYRLYDADHQPIKYGKFQQLDRLAKALQTSVSDLPVLDDY
ncbi:MAG TPA: hypothetical protein VD907_00075 [Verrucomicrobiae bacterium]|nr:hypothetical protein [Verrucomicrobiae bacterium]